MLRKKKPNGAAHICLSVRVFGIFCFSFEWGCRANSRPDVENPDSTPDDCLVVIKEDQSVEIHHVQLKETRDDMLDDVSVMCDVVVTADLLQSLLRDRGKG